MTEKIKESFVTLLKNTAKVACARFRRRIKAVVDDDGGVFFERIFT